ncbi:anthrax toxin lethal factor-related metalloendopeptidase [Butyrivibrio sp. VCB2001]|uniref:anthrax toxin lethal factor-related metalloendopeptidase n=1 Tax=Butyrivibrio sp. VCB2001 TaxID=1280667 RepID=UPI00047C22F7|nr:hypothetical protein [Butyrivibrio sp. VCB2001]
MRKIRITIILLCSIISIYANSIVVFASCPISQSTSKSASAEAEKYYNMLPSALRKQFESEGWTITITSVTAVNMASAAFGGVSGAGYVAGFTHGLSKMIILADTDAGSAINHEMGHYLDYSKNMPSESALFQDIYKSEATLFDGGSNEYAKSAPAEYFAEAFREYIECGGYLKSTCPRTYSFIDGYVFAYGGTQTENVMEYTRCNSHILDVAAKAVADAAAKAARSAAQGMLDSGAKLIGKNAPKLDEWLSKYGDVIDAINSDPEGYAKKKSDEWIDYMDSIDWDKKNAEVAEKAKQQAEDLNKLFSDEEYWEKKGKDAADNLNKKTAEWGKKAEETDWEQKGKDFADKLKGILGGN